MTAPETGRDTERDTERKLQELSFLHEITRLASSTRDWDEMLRLIIDRTTDAMNAEVSSLYLLERRDALLRLAATNGLDRRSIGRATLRVGEGIVGWVANARVPLAVRDVRNEPRFKWVSSVDQPRFTSMLSVPLVTRDEVVGVMNVQTVEARDFDRSEMRLPPDHREPARRDHRDEPAPPRRRAEASRGLGALRGLQRSHLDARAR